MSLDELVNGRLLPLKGVNLLAGWWRRGEGKGGQRSPEGQRAHRLEVEGVERFLECPIREVHHVQSLRDGTHSEVKRQKTKRSKQTKKKIVGNFRKRWNPSTKGRVKKLEPHKCRHGRPCKRQRFGVQNEKEQTQYPVSDARMLVVRAFENVFAFFERK